MTNGSGSFDELVAVVYGELRVMARSYMRSQKPGHTLQPTALVNEAYLRLAQGNTHFESRGHFFGALPVPCARCWWPMSANAIP